MKRAYTRMSKNKILITGGMGFIGSNLVRKLNANYPNFEITIVDNLINGYPYQDIISRNKFLKIDVTNYNDLVAIDSQFSHIVHLAALGSVPRSLSDPRSTFLSNVVGTQNICDLAKEHNARVLFASSSSVFGGGETFSRIEEAPRNPISPYGFSKVHGEQILESYSQSFGLKVCAMRFFNVYGPYQNMRNEYAAVIPKIINSSINSKIFEIYGSGDQTRDFTYVDDLCNVIVGLLKLDSDLPEKINIAWSKEVSINSIIQIINQISANKLNTINKPERNGDIFKSKNDSSLLKTLFPNIEPTLIRDAICSTYEWTKTVDKNIYYG
jgi:UDP-glucose 4-epimerase